MPTGVRRLLGREAELESLLEALDLTPPRTTAAWSISGPAGIGKTALARAVDVAARARGWRVVWAHGWAGAGVPTYWPWTQALRELQGSSQTRLVDLLFAQEAPADQFDLFDAVARRLDALADGPLLIIVDDLHVADPDSLHLLRFLSRHRAADRRMVLGAWRLTAGEHFDAAELGLSGDVRLSGLDLAHAGLLLGGAQDLAELHQLTGGNPLHLTEVARSRRAHASWRPARESLAHVARRRIAEVSSSSQEAVAAVAVLGPHATIDHVGALVGRESAVARRAVDAAVAAGLLIEASPIRVSHPIFGEASLAQLRPDRLRELHVLAAGRLDAEREASAVAAHLVAAGPEHRVAAVELLLAAARAATAAFAHDLAVDRLVQADELLSAVDSEQASLRLRWETTFALAGAVMSAQGRVAAEPHYDRAAALAAALDDPQIVARTAVGHGIEYYTSGDHTIKRAEQCRSALDRLPAEPSALHVRLQAQVAVSGMSGTEPAVSRVLAAEAVRMAHAVGDDRALAHALVAEQVVDLGPASLTQRLDSGERIVALAERLGDVPLAIHGRLLLKAALLESGRVRELDRHINLQQQQILRVSEARWARHGLWFRCMQAMLDADPDRVEELAGRIGVIADQLADPDGIGVYFGQLGIARWMQGRLDEMEDAYRSQLREEPDEPLWPSVLAWVALQSGRLEDARGWMQLFTAPLDVPQSQHTLLTLCTMADVVARLGDDAQIAATYEALAPYGDRTVPVALGAGLFGPVARFLGTLAARQGRPELAEQHFVEALTVAGRLGARAWACDAQLALAELLLDADRDRAAMLVRQAATIRSSGAVVFEERLRALEDRLAEPLSLPVAQPVARIAVLGDFAVFGLDGTPARWSSRKARTLLKMLVAADGGFVSRDRVLAELWPDVEPALLGNRLAVALTTARRALDPARSLATPLVTAVSDGIRLELDHPEARIEVDVRAFLAASRWAQATGAQIREALDSYAGPPFSEEPYADWAQPMRDETAVALLGLLGRALDLADAESDHGAVADIATRILGVEPYDERAHRARVRALRALGAHSAADRALDAFAAARAELGLSSPSRL